MILKNVCYHYLIRETSFLITKGIIFDLDGTLVDTLDDLTDSMNAALAQLGRPVCLRQQCRTMIGNGLHKFAERALGLKDVQLADELFMRMVDHYKVHCLLKTTVYPGVKDAINPLLKKGIRLAVLTNKNQESAEVIVHHFFGKDTFDPIVGAADGRKGKPDSQTTLDILRQWNLTADEVFLIGDSEADAKAAIAAGVRCVGCEWGFRSKNQLLEAGVELFVQQPSQILNLIS